MSEEDQTTRILTELELSEYETRAYLSIVEGGVMVARDVSDRASIPYAKVYQTLNGLIEKQLIIGDEGRPKKFKPRSPKDAINDRLKSLENSWKENHQRRKKQLDSILPELQELFDNSGTSLEEEQGVWNISGSTNIASRISKLVGMTEDTIIVITGNYNVFEENFLKLLRSAPKIPITLITNKNVDNSAFASVYKHDQVGDAIVIIFDQFAMISIAELQRGRYSGGEFTAVLTQIFELVKSALTNYEVMMK